MAAAPLSSLRILLISRPAFEPPKPTKIMGIYWGKLRLIFFKKSLVKFFTMRHCPSASGGTGQFFNAGSVSLEATIRSMARIRIITLWLLFAGLPIGGFCADVEMREAPVGTEAKATKAEEH